MKTIGEILKQRRIELGYSIEDIHDKTKLSPVHIRAIETGDLDYFRHDLSYLKFFLQYYCQAVYLDFDEIKGDYEKVLSNYYETQAIKKVEQTQASNENIQRRIKNHQSNYRKPKGSKNIQFKKIDNQTIVILVVVALLAALLLFGFMKLVLPRLTGSNNDPVINEVDQPEVEVPETPEVKPETPPVEPEPTLKTPSVVTESYDNYRISNFNEESDFILKFSADTWIQVYINDDAVEIPEPRVYAPGEEIVIDLESSVKKITLELGNLTGTNVFVDETEVVLDETAKSTTNGILLNFHFEGQ